MPGDVPLCRPIILLGLAHLFLVRFPPMRDALQYLLSVLIHFELRYLDLRGCDTERHALTIALLARDPFHMDDIFKAVDGSDFALATFVAAAHDNDFVVFAEGDRRDLLYRRLWVRSSLTNVPKMAEGIHCASLLAL